MFATIINDCYDANVSARQATRFGSLIDASVHTSGVNSDIEAAGCLVDALDAAEGREGIISVNVAPRSGTGKKWPNGTPFGYFYFHKTLVVTTIDGLTLSLVKKLGLTESVNVFDIPTVMKYATDKNLLDNQTAERIIKSQFRSFDFEPRAAVWLKEGHELPFVSEQIATFADAPACVWYIDNFNNSKTTILESELQVIETSPIKTSGSNGKVNSVFGQFNYYPRLKDLPEGEIGFYTGSSGIDTRRFVEFSIQDVHGNLPQKFNFKVGAKLF